MGENVLFVDDDMLFLDGLSRTLRHEPFNILKACSAPEALRIMRDTSVAVVVSDLRMPGSDGVKLLTQVATHHPTAVGIMLSGNLSLETAKALVNRSVATRLFEKPVREQELLTGIRGALAESRHRRERVRSLELLQMQRSYIEHLEQEHPGILIVKRDEHGVVLIDDIDEEGDGS